MTIIDNLYISMAKNDLLWLKVGLKNNKHLFYEYMKLSKSIYKCYMLFHYVNWSKICIMIHIVYQSYRIRSVKRSRALIGQDSRNAISLYPSLNVIGNEMILRDIVINLIFNKQMIISSQVGTINIAA